MMLIVVVTSLFGEDGFLYLLGGSLVLYLALWAYVEGTKPRFSPPRVRATAPPPPPLSPDRPAKRVWIKYADDIQHRFDVDAQIAAHNIYKANDAEGLERFCEQTLKRMSKSGRAN